MVILAFAGWMAVILINEQDRKQYEITKTDNISLTITGKEIDFGTKQVNSDIVVPMRDVNYYLFFDDIKYLVDKETYERYDVGDIVTGTLTYTYDLRQPNIRLEEKWRLIQ